MIDISIIEAGDYITYRKDSHPDNEKDYFGLILNFEGNYIFVAFGDYFHNVQSHEITSHVKGTSESQRIAIDYYNN